MMQEWREQARANVLAVAAARGETLTEAQIRRRMRVRLAFRAIGTVGLGAAKIAGGAVGIGATIAGAAVDTITGKKKP